MLSTDLASCWNHLGKLVKRPAEGCALERELDLLRALQEQVRASVSSRELNARDTSMTAHGLASVEVATRWRANETTWQAVSSRASTLVSVGEFTPQGLSVSYFFNLPKLVLYLELGVSKYVATHRPPRQPLGK